MIIIVAVPDAVAAAVIVVAVVVVLLLVVALVVIHLPVCTIVVEFVLVIVGHGGVVASGESEYARMLLLLTGAYSWYSSPIIMVTSGSNVGYCMSL